MQIELRERAEEQIGKGTAPATQGWTAGIQALTLLHGLASSPETASDALKLLHELQVHQVELDLQHEQAEQDRSQLTEHMTTYTALFEQAPFAYLALSAEGLIIAANRIAARWLQPGSGEGNEWTGRQIEDLLAPECRAPVRDMLVALRNGKGRQSCAVQSMGGGSIAHAVATAPSGDGQVLMAFMPLEVELGN